MWLPRRTCAYCDWLRTSSGWPSCPESNLSALDGGCCSTDSSSLRRLCAGVVYPESHCRSISWTSGAIFRRWRRWYGKGKYAAVDRDLPGIYHPYSLNLWKLSPACCRSTGVHPIDVLGLAAIRCLGLVTTRRRQRCRGVLGRRFIASYGRISRCNWIGMGRLLPPLCMLDFWADSCQGPHFHFHFACTDSRIRRCDLETVEMFTHHRLFGRRPPLWRFEFHSGPSCGTKPWLFHEQQHS